MSKFYDINKTLVIPSAYKTSLIYPIKPTGLLAELVFSRSTTSNRFNKNLVVENVAINTPRLNYNTVNGCPSILFEPARTNLLLQSETINGWAASSVNFTKTNTTVLGLNASKLFCNTTSNGADYQAGLRYVSMPCSLLASTTYTMSFFVEKTSANSVFSMFFFTNFSGFDGQYIATFNATSLTTTTTAGYGGAYTNKSAKITQVSGNVFFCETTFTTPASNSSVISITFGFGPQGVNTQIAGNEGSFTGLQIEQGTFSTSRILTTTATVTRTVDIITDATPQFMNLGSKGTIVLDISNIKVTNSGAFAGFVIGDNYLNQQISLANQSTDGIGVYNYNNSTFIIPRFTANSKILIKFDGSYVCGYRNGTKLTETYNTTGLNITQIKDWYNPLNSFELNNLQVYPIALSDADCVKLTI